LLELEPTSCPPITTMRLRTGSYVAVCPNCPCGGDNSEGAAGSVANLVAADAALGTAPDESAAAFPVPTAAVEAGGKNTESSSRGMENQAREVA
jgi:hypothetical protein